MTFPKEFSPQARARIEAERIRAKHALAESRAQKPPDTWRFVYDWDLREFHRYILRVFLAFAHEAFELGKSGVWMIDRIKSEANQFLDEFAAEAHSEYRHDRSGLKFPEMFGEFRGGLTPTARQALQKTDEWYQFEDELLTLAEHIAGPVTSAGATGQNRHVQLLEQIVARTNIRVETWASDHGFGRTTFFDWKSGREAGIPLKGKVSEDKAKAIEKAIERDAEQLGLSTRTDSY